MNDLEIQQLSRFSLIKFAKEQDKAIFQLVAEVHDKDKIIKRLRTHVETLLESCGAAKESQDQ